MANNNYRVIANFRKDPKLNRLINAIANKFPNYDLGSNTPIPNQALETATTNGNPTCIYFDEYAVGRLNRIRELAQEKSSRKFQSNKEDKSIDFVCTGYLDHDGDIRIIDIDIPALNVYEEENKNPLKAIFKGDKSKATNIETQSYYYDYLRNSDYVKKTNIGRMPVALLGTTRPITTTKDGTEYCPRLSEIAKAIVPANVEFNHPVISGTLSVSPNYIVQTPFGERYASGSLECVLINYTLNNNKTLTPCKFTNVTRAQEGYENGTRKIIEISKSQQPLEGLPILSQEKVR